MIHKVWFFMMGGSVFYACMTGRGGKVLSAALEGTQRSVGLTMELCAGYLLFCGLLEIAKALGIPQRMSRLMRPFFRLLMPGTQKAVEAAAMNLSMNMLGLGNAATPMGLEAMRQLDQERKTHPLIRHDMYMFLILNATSIQLIPTTMITLRIAADSPEPGAILLPTLLCTAVSTAAGVSAGMVCRKWRRRHAD